MDTALINNEYPSALPLKKVMESFFAKNTPDKVKHLFWKLFQCYVIKDCNVKAEMPDQEVALFYDQLMDLVAAAYILHQANGVSNDTQKGNKHE